MVTSKRIGIWSVRLDGLAYQGKYKGLHNQVRISTKVGKDLYMEKIYTGWDANQIFESITVEAIAVLAAKVPHFRPIAHLFLSQTPPVKTFK